MNNIEKIKETYSVPRQININFNIYDFKEMLI